MLKYPIFLQDNENSCGAYCIKMLLSFYKRDDEIKNIKKCCRLTKEGVTVYGLIQVLKKYHLEAKAYQCEFKHLFEEVNCPVIIHLKQDYNENDIFGESPVEAIAPMMDVIGTIDRGIIRAIKNSGVVRWLLNFKTSMRDEDIKSNVEKFVRNYLAVETDTFGAAGVDAKADVQRIEPKDYVPNAAQTDRTIERIYSFFNTNKKIVQSDYTENEWTAYYEAEIEPIVVQMHQTYTVGIFSRKERGFGNRIVFEANNLQCASLTTKLAFQAMVDRGAMTPNEWRETMNMTPIPGGDQPIRRLDTQVVNLLKDCLNKINTENYAAMTQVMVMLLKGKEVKEDET